MQEPEWIFGYGSLIWRPDFPFAEQAPGRIHGYKRRFWQGSPDHRGTENKPGRVVTLIPHEDEPCEGMAFRLNEHERDEVMAHLDHREKGGYDRKVVEITLHSGEVVSGITWYATHDNPWFLGEADVVEIAKHILECVGPSGPNIEYLERLFHVQSHDPHISDIMLAVHELRGNQ